MYCTVGDVINAQSMRRCAVLLFSLPVILFLGGMKIWNRTLTETCSLLISIALSCNRDVEFCSS